MPEEWRPGSFTKNFSWGLLSDGLKRLYEAINIGFEDSSVKVERELFRNRIRKLNRPDFIPMNFFLYNQICDGRSYLVCDELVFQALNFPHSDQFDKLALFSFALSETGNWQGAQSYQSRPALWAKHYIAERVGTEFAWDANRINAEDIEAFVEGDNRYTGQTSRKLATNFNYLLKAGRIDAFQSRKPERWWLSAIFVALDRTVETDEVEFGRLGEARLIASLVQSKFWEISGRRSSAKEIALAYYVTLYAACGGRQRFLDEETLERERIMLPNNVSNAPPNADAIGVFHPSNPIARNAIPHACRVLAKYLAGFESFEMEEWDNFDLQGYIHSRTANALAELDRKGIKPRISADDLTKALRGE